MDEHTLNIRPPVWLPIVVVIIAGGMYIGGKVVESQDRTPTIITVSGDGKVVASPDIAEVSFGVQTGPQVSAKVAVQKLDKDMKSVLAAVKATGIDDKDVRTQQFYLSPMYDWNDGKQTLRGYEASQQVTVKVRDLDKVGELLSTVSENGVNQIGGISFTIDNPDELQAQARREAIEKAQEKAVKLAKDLGMTLGKLKGYNEGGGYAPPMPYATRSMGVGGGMDAIEEKAISVPEGQQEIRVDVSLSYELR